MSTPLLSVVIASYNSGSTIAACLRSLQRQTCGPLEVIVVDSSRDGTEQLVAAEFPGVQLVRSADRKFPGDARNLGIERARGELIACLDADCQVEADWAERLVEAHRRREEPVIGTAIAPDPDYDLVGWAAYFCKCTRWAPETPARRMSDLPACSLSFQRGVFAECGPFLEGTYCSDTAFSWAVRARGHGLWFEPSIAVRHWYNPALLAFLRRQLWHGRTFARVRRACRGMPRWRSLGRGLAWPLLVPLLLGRIVHTVVRHRIQVNRFVRCWPVVCLGLLAWCAGEGLGYLE